jgi:hypothetical protein
MPSIRYYIDLVEQSLLTETPTSGEPSITVERDDRHYEVFVDGRKAGDVYLAGTGGADIKPFVDLAMLRDGYIGKRIASVVYDRIEADLGRRLVPNPLGLSPAAISFWRRRLDRLTPEQRREDLDLAWEIGRSYGIRDESIAARFDPLEMAGR